jgi:hypothetical protein
MHSDRVPDEAKARCRGATIFLDAVEVAGKTEPRCPTASSQPAPRRLHDRSFAPNARAPSFAPNLRKRIC